MNPALTGLAWSGPAKTGIEQVVHPWDLETADYLRQKALVAFEVPDWKLHSYKRGERTAGSARIEAH